MLIRSFDLFSHLSFVEQPNLASEIGGLFRMARNTAQCHDMAIWSLSFLLSDLFQVPRCCADDLAENLLTVWPAYC